MPKSMMNIFHKRDRVTKTCEGTLILIAILNVFLKIFNYDDEVLFTICGSLVKTFSPEIIKRKSQEECSFCSNKIICHLFPS